MAKKKPVQEIPIRNLRIDDPIGMPIVIERLFAAPRLVHLQGTPDDGNTAFAFKVVFTLHEHKPDARLLWIYFDDELTIWRNRFEKLVQGASVEYQKFDSKSPSYFHHILLKGMESTRYRLVIVDGLYYSNLELPGWKRHQFLRLLHAHAKRCGIPILVTDRQKFPEDTEPEGNKDPDIKGTGECWSLHRPMYRTAALGQGNTFVIMPREMEWEDGELKKTDYLS